MYQGSAARRCTTTLPPCIFSCLTVGWCVHICTTYHPFANLAPFASPSFQSLWLCPRLITIIQRRPCQGPGTNSTLESMQTFPRFWQVTDSLLSPSTANPVAQALGRMLRALADPIGLSHCAFCHALAWLGASDSRTYRMRAAEGYRGWSKHRGQRSETLS